MFPARYFARRYFAPRYWPKVGATAAAVVPTILIDAPRRLPLCDAPHRPPRFDAPRR